MSKSKLDYEVLQWEAAIYTLYMLKKEKGMDKVPAFYIVMNFTAAGVNPATNLMNMEKSGVITIDWVELSAEVADKVGTNRGAEFISLTAKGLELGHDLELRVKKGKASEQN